MSLRKLSIGSVAAISVIFLLVSLYLEDPQDELQRRLTSVINGLIHVEDEHIRLSPRVAVGYGACVDLYVEGSSFLPYNHHASSPQHFDEISSMEQLYKSYAYYFKYGAASERYVSNSSLFDELLHMASDQPGSRYLVSGNAPVMATRLYLEGCQVLLAATLSQERRKAIPKEITVVGGSTSRDDYHLVIEYKAGEKWGPFVTPRSNRYILHNDYNNPHLTSFLEFNKRLKSFNPDLLIVSGLQLMDNFPFQKGVREKKLEAISDQMRSMGKKAKIHFEMASISEEKLLLDLSQLIIPYSDSLGMNEQELANLHSLYMYGNNTLVTDSTPRVATVLDQMRDLFRLIRERRSNVAHSRKLTRLHVHTLAYQAFLVDKTSIWTNTHVAAAKASLTAFRHVCASPQVEARQAMLLMDESFSVSLVGRGRVDLVPDSPVACWNESNMYLCVAPGIVCTSPSVTAGGGDNISAAALAMQLSGAVLADSKKE